MKILATADPTVGHYVALVGILEEAVQRGHTVDFIIGPMVVPSWVERIMVDRGIRIHRVILQASSSPSYLELSRDPSGSIEFFRLDTIRFDPRIRERARQLIVDLEPDVVLTEGIPLWAALAAAEKGIPYVSVPIGAAYAFSQREDTATAAARSLLPEREALFQEIGAPTPRFLQNSYLSHDCCFFRLLQEALPPPHQDPPRGTTFIGGALPRNPEWLFGRELPADFPKGRFAYVSFGTLLSGAERAEAVSRVAEACRRLRLDCVVAAGGLPLDLSPRPGLFVYDLLPQALALERAEFFVTHGGGSAYFDGLWAGVPMFVWPQFWEHFIFADLVEYAQIGLSTLSRGSSIENLHEAFHDLQNDPGIQGAVERFKRLIRDPDKGSSMAVDTLERQYH
jgi:UDP:flavonoid glycosyltransferase YjiC (YdhE family)